MAHGIWLFCGKPYVFHKVGRGRNFHRLRFVQPTTAIRSLHKTLSHLSLSCSLTRARRLISLLPSSAPAIPMGPSRPHWVVSHAPVVRRVPLGWSAPPLRRRSRSWRCKEDSDSQHFLLQNVGSAFFNRNYETSFFSKSWSTIFFSLFVVKQA
jgi:hypothetical protein